MIFEQYRPWLGRVSTLMKSMLRSDIPYVQQLVDYQLMSQGKMLRPLVVLTSARIVGEDNVDTLRAAAAIELMHNGTLLHDDVVDQSLVRHNRPTVNAAWNDKAAVLLGDYLLSQGMRLMTSVRNIDMLDSLMRCGEQLSEGELYQQKQSHDMQPNEQLYYDIIDRKTASLFASCAYCGALSAGADANTAMAIEKLGREMGLIFQIRDDILDYEPQNAREIAKPVLHDVYEGKITLPLILAMRYAPAETTTSIMNVLHAMCSKAADAYSDMASTGMDMASTCRDTASTGMDMASTGKDKASTCRDMTCHVHHDMGAGFEIDTMSDEQKLVLNFVEANHGIEQARNVLEQKKNSIIGQLHQIPSSNHAAVAEMSALIDFAASRSK